METEIADAGLRRTLGVGVDREVAEHRQSFIAFRHLVVFAAAHIGLTLACVALAFVGHIKLVALLVWLGGTLAMVAFLALHAAGKTEASTNFEQRR